MRYEHVWELIRKNDFQLIDEIPDDYKCAICKNILKNACSAPCGCRFCKNCISDHMAAPNIYCPGETDHCKDEEISFDTHIQIDHAINSRIVKLIAKCPKENCDFRDELQKLEIHYETCRSRQTIAEEDACDLVECIDNLKSELSSMRSEMHTMQANVERNRTELEQLAREGLERHELISDLQYNLDEMNRDVSDITLTRTFKQDELRQELTDISDREKRKRKDLNELLVDLDAKISRIEDCHEQHGCDEFIWRIDQFSEKRRDAQSGVATRLKSEPFYSHRNGYRLCLTVYPDGNCSGKGTHLAVYFQLLRGEFDAILPWPMRRIVDVAIVNQQHQFGTEHRSFQYRMFPEAVRTALHQPVTDSNASCGTPKFVSFETLERNGALLKDDRIFLRCTVSMPR